MNNHKEKIFDYPLFSLGFRAFFALAVLSALVLITLWNGLFKGEIELKNYFQLTGWHAHEMLMGYTSAVIAGFLLTAIRNWTSQATLSGDQLAGLCLLWLYGRILPFYSGLLPDLMIAIVDWAFLPVLIAALVKPVLAARDSRSTVFMGLLLVMAIANTLIHVEQLGMADNVGQLGIQLLVYTIITMILVIAGIVFPFFTEKGLSGTMAIRSHLLDVLSVVTGVSVFVLQMFDIGGAVLIIAVVGAVIANLARVAGWYIHRIWYVPLLWILYVGYGWIILGFVLVGMSAYGLIPAYIPMHAFTVGGIGVLTMGMMARVTLGHTGRILKTSNVIAIAFVLINLSAFARVIMPAILPDWYGQMLYLSILCWLAAFSLFLYYYGPILAAPREDGKPG
ncbi:NnrS family protein [Methylicorpusculum sp.]|uniref:NnrS family protein n=1 Tax=Methylicorpusculum sp. TaxID=2713644 RepID=UPI002AB8E9D5|nr:NnrS family protein [Methylicorpusculum sp.]MDZ4150570.1 NnrS family protein [Methylicorpusculum sp.]